MKNLLRIYFLIGTIGVLLLPSCSDDDEKPVFPLSASIFQSVDGKQVAFTALTHNAVSWQWDFGNGETSTEQNPVYVYPEGGYYIATLTAKDKDGNTASDEVKLAISLTPYALLTGDHTADGYDGKTWKLTSSHVAAGDYLAIADAALSVVSGTPKPLPDGIFNTEFGMGDIYKDEFTFYYDGSYKHDVKADGATFGGIVYQFVMNGGADIINANGKDYGLCIAKYTPQNGATFTFTENENLTIPSVYGAAGTITYSNVSTLDFSGNEFIGFRDYQRKVIVTKITDSSLQVAMFMAASPDYFPANTNALILSFEVVE
ncbi:PKD domain-containing protein [Maribellus sp. YY47]|uniref:PKD domain-containing protein n=1 Tax=Maribellus sp. YY47 TaxID=2929486 RepID=UPI002001322B|nr:PKD domain-containing protein [Maribellus sp. YY47]MCK3682830.1 PKD domain-containing protein [Maribellus sp. YY47]